ncbi:MAG: amidohydrolase [Chloroflexota bacterium]
MPADLIVTNAKIYTAELDQKWASAFAVRDGKFLAVGADEDIQAFAGPDTSHMDLQGQLVLPGLCDAHIHFTMYALSLNRIDLFEVPSLDELKRRLAEKAQATPSGTWLQGFGWNQTLWDDPRFPTKDDLDEITTDHPVMLKEKSGHAAIVNSVALQAAGITEGIANPDGGEFVRDVNGALTGLLFEAPAMNLVSNIIPPPTEAELDAAVIAAQKVAHQFGLVAVHDLDGKQGFTTFQRLHRQGKLRVRAVSHVAMAQLDDALGLGLRVGLGDAWLRVGGLKLFADGALGPRTAAMLAPYEGEPDNYGITIVDKEDMIAMASKASAAGLPTVVHAIGDRANHDVLDVFAAIRTQEAERNVARQTLRHRLEHVQVLHPDDLYRLADLDVIASVQPIHCTQDMKNIDRYWGDRGQYSYAFRTFLDSGATLAFGSDAPVETPNPFVGIHAAVTRRRADGYPGEAGWYPEQRLTVAEAVDAYTIGAAYAESLDTVMGSICVGKYADFIVPDQDIFECDPMVLKDVQVKLTVIDGETVFQREEM